MSPRQKKIVLALFLVNLVVWPYAIVATQDYISRRERLRQSGEELKIDLDKVDKRLGAPDPEFTEALRKELKRLREESDKKTPAVPSAPDLEKKNVEDKSSDSPSGQNSSSEPRPQETDQAADPSGK